MGKVAKRQKLKLKKAEKKEFKRFAKAARKVGLLVTRDSYIRYFSDSSKH
ncbi:hypothetical protein [Bradyrhizobium sp.]|nr:hypothetical protein [Bradyrhizobium sp.]MBV8701466.1 hypothetical protein [Bradyrhizobium sp.]MBV9980786.1 hypothetical protein [Bradyrhizobium sp.]